MTLADCRLAVDELLHSIEQYKAVMDSPFYRCNLNSYFIQMDSKISIHFFDCGAVKAQRGEASKHTDAEKEARSVPKLYE